LDEAKPFLLGMGFGLAGRDVPILFIFDSAIFENEIVTREEFLNAVEHSQGGGDVSEGEIFLESGKV
jgi:ABC-type uncharacterized transport system YnjBCD permease subunit